MNSSAVLRLFVPMFLNVLLVSCDRKCRVRYQSAIIATAMYNCMTCYIAREQHINALPCEIQNENGSVGGRNRLFASCL